MTTRFSPTLPTPQTKTPAREPSSTTASTTAIPMARLCGAVGVVVVACATRPRRTAPMLFAKESQSTRGESHRTFLRRERSSGRKSHGSQTNLITLMTHGIRRRSRRKDNPALVVFQHSVVLISIKCVKVIPQIYQPWNPNLPCNDASFPYS